MLMCDWISDVCSSDLLAVDPEVEADRRQFLERYILGQTVYHVKKTGRNVERAGLRQRIDDLVQVARRQMEVTAPAAGQIPVNLRSDEHTYELQSLMRIAYAVFCLKTIKHTIDMTH